MFDRIAIVAAALSISGCKQTDSPTPAPAPRDARSAPADAKTIAVELPPPPLLPVPHRGLPRLPVGARKTTAARVELGRLLFSDANVFGGSCARCHDPARGFSSPSALDKTERGTTNLRNTPSLHDLAFREGFYRDGRADSIVALLPGHARGQLGADLDEVAVRIAEQPLWRAHFARAFSEAPSPPNIAIALADFCRTRYSPRSPWDRHEANEPDAVSASAIRGAALFRDNAGCAICHPPPLYTDLEIHRTAVAAGLGPADRGRARISNAAVDERAFVTPTLRGSAQTAPYFHAGTATTLAEAVDVELSRADAGLTGSERADLISFLQSLSP